MTHLVEIPRDDHAPVAARQVLRAVEGRFRRDDADLLVTEVVTNAVRHGAGDRVRMTLNTTAGGGLHCEVVDDGDGFVPAETRHKPRDEPGGWGLMLVDQLSTAWGVHTGSTHVWFELSPHN